MKKSSKVAPAPALVSTPVPTKEAPPSERTRKVRPSKFEGTFLKYVPTPVVLGVNNGADVRRQKASRRTASRAILAAAGDAGLSFAAYLAAGGNAGDLARDVRKGATLASREPFAALAAPVAGKAPRSGRKAS